jgi:hypothetical protein
MDLFWIVTTLVLVLIARGLVTLCDRTRDRS